MIFYPDQNEKKDSYNDIAQDLFGYMLKLKIEQRRELKIIIDRLVNLCDSK